MAYSISITLSKNINIAELVVCLVHPIAYLYLLIWMSVITIRCSLLVAALLELVPLRILWPSASLPMCLESQDLIYVYITTTSYLLATTCFAFLSFLQLPKGVIDSMRKFPACRKYILSRLHCSLFALLMDNLLEYINVGEKWSSGHLTVTFWGY